MLVEVSVIEMWVDVIIVVVSGAMTALGFIMAVLSTNVMNMLSDVAFGVWIGVSAAGVVITITPELTFQSTRQPPRLE